MPTGYRPPAGSAPAPEIATLLDALDRAYNRKSWHGPNLRGSLRGLTPAEAVRRPATGRHNIAELVVHAAYWKYTVWRRLTGARRGSFALEGSDFFARSGREGERRWKADLALLDQVHGELRETIAAVPAADLDARVPRGRVTRRDLITGIAAHDLYHAGQIQLIKRLIR